MPSTEQGNEGTGASESPSLGGFQTVAQGQKHRHPKVGPSTQISC